MALTQKLDNINWSLIFLETKNRRERREGGKKKKRKRGRRRREEKRKGRAKRYGTMNFCMEF